MYAGSLVSHELLTAVRSELELPELKLILKSSWSSSYDDHRLRIRENLLSEIEKFVEVTPTQRQLLLDLKQTPILPQVGFSISHNKNCGGFVINPQGDAVGFDIEIVDRVKEKLIRRVSVSSEEVERAPSAASLWTAKEAALKSLFRSGLQPNVIAEIEIGDWRKVNGVESCNIILKDHKFKTNRGCVVNLEDMKLAVFTVN